MELDGSQRALKRRNPFRRGRDHCGVLAHKEPDASIAAELSVLGNYYAILLECRPGDSEEPRPMHVREFDGARFRSS